MILLIIIKKLIIGKKMVFKNMLNKDNLIKILDLFPVNGEFYLVFPIEKSKEFNDFIIKINSLGYKSSFRTTEIGEE